MTQLSILGTGNMGTAIADLATRGGHSVQLLGSSDTDRKVAGDIVVLAVPYPKLDEVLAQRGESLAGKIVVDITNPLDFGTFDSLVVPADSSAAAELAAKLPQSRVVKAFNTTFAPTLGKPEADTESTAGATAVLVAGDDDAAKQAVSAVVTDGGLRAVDAGSLTRARELEAIGCLQITLAVREQIGWTNQITVA